MKHSADLIGSTVHVYRHEWVRPDLPRAGIIAGFAHDKGLFTIIVMHCPIADMRKGLPPLGYLTACLVVDDEDDTPVGVTEYARLRTQVVASAPARLAASLVIGTGQPVPDPPAKVRRKAATPAREPEPEPEPEPATPEPTPEPEPTPKAPRPGGRTPCEILVNTAAWSPVSEICGDRAEIVHIGPNEMIVQRVGDDRPLARVIYTAFTGNINEPSATPAGFSVKVRDPAGRCSRPLGENLLLPEDVGRVCLTLALAIEAAFDADAGDWAGSASSMTPVLAAARADAD
jgi:hypothetical protein